MTTHDPNEVRTAHTIPLVEESVELRRKVVDRGGYRISKRITHETQNVDEVLSTSEVRVERRPVGKQVATEDLPKPYQEGDTYVIPILEERLVVTRQIFLVEEVRISGVLHKRSHQELVSVRKEHIDIERLGAERSSAPSAQAIGQLPNSSQRDTPKELVTMKSSLVAMFDSQSAAQSAHEQLLAAGFSPESVTMAGGSTATAAAGTNTGVDTEPLHENAVVRFFKNLFGDDHADSNAEGEYREAFRRGSYGLTVNVEDSQIDQAESILNDAGAVDIDERTRQWQSENSAVGLSAASTPGAAAQGMSTPGTAVLSETPQSTSQTTGVGTGGNRTLQEINEELKVGKRVVSRGGIRIYSRMVETPVEETVRLREEHADVQRRAVDRPATEADLSAFKEGSFEVRETAEEPVVEKTARVVGEVDVGKRVTERDETISDTVRQTRVDVQDLEKAQSSGTAYTPDAPKKI